MVGIRHKETEKNEKITKKWAHRSFGNSEKDFEVELDAKADLFMEDVMNLLNRFIPVDTEKFDHPSAYALPIAESKYYTVNPKTTYNPLKMLEERETATLLRESWKPIESDGMFYEADSSLNSSLKPLIANMHKSISSALLFYRLLCLWQSENTRFTQINFFDFHGLAEVTVSKEFEERFLEKRACELLAFFVSDGFPHPFVKGLVVGSVDVNEIF
ncbi:hypothetical protein HK098_003688 [Nowakowskiella sp. JEL0407]|nr:hypothetical protein HK098_003688 [Nowakowskiella sp. JEL0407]